MLMTNNNFFMIQTKRTLYNSPTGVMGSNYIVIYNKAVVELFFFDR